MTDLETKIHEANVAYWQNHSPNLSDAEYDALMIQLRKENPNSPLLDTVGGTRGKYKHAVPMLSLDKAYEYNEVVNWLTSIPGNPDIYIEPKYDGLAGKIENNRLVTRGDGVYGQDITHVKPIINNLPNESYTLGEILITLDKFNEWFKSGKLLQQDGSKYANPRNAVAGLVNRKEICDLPEDLIKFCKYEPIITCKKNELSLERIKSAIEEIAQTFKSQYPIDGVVFTLPPDSREYAAMGYTAHHPKGAIAYKFGNNSQTGIVANVEWQQGREVLTPVLQLKDRLDFDDVMVSRATLHNYDQFLKANLHVGDIVNIERAGGVIPKFSGVVSRSNGVLITAPTTCPCCRSDVVVQGVDLVCTNDKCSGKIVPKLVYSAKCLRIDGLGPKTAYMLYDKLKIMQLYELLQYNYLSNLMLLPGFTEYSAELLYSHIKNAVNTVYDWEVSAACCVPGIGPELFKAWHTSGFSWKKLDDLTVVDSLEGMSTERYRCIRTFYLKNKHDVDAMFETFKPIASTIEETKGLICCTGSADVPRKELSRLITAAGYTFTDKMSADVKILATNDLNKTSKKMEYARGHAIPIVDYPRLYLILGNVRNSGESEHGTHCDIH